MLKLATLLVAFALSYGTGCTPKKTAAQDKAEQDKLKKEERKQKAAKYYDDLIKKYPDSEYAEDAKKRLQALGPISTPKPR